ncbi:hypothetical protein K458DRAFT_198719 [Lentithecium fluviatile CBS 122367]|uniref:Uncharacterized protein n=1 Tax=Lentithecium fluviatile CBS 122367 TaxID=1168545 RepID=A0A6G1J8E7_9PLEO|nr:hypothetical protein K458DRAFT_198719 [Lentithecium fluviatile CBS 122367]
MGKAFFTEWELWQQMTFVLACGIVATVFVGLCKLWYDQRKIRKYTKVEKGKQAQTPEMLEAQREETKDDIPFGIRAIESGIEIDGVWISRSNTPVTSSRSSITGVQLPRSYNSSQLELPQAMAQGSSRNSSRAPSSFDVAVNAERINSNDSRASSPRARQPPADCCTKCGHSSRNRNSSTLQALEGYPTASANSSARRDPINDKSSSSSNSGNNSGKSSRRTSDESDFMALTEGRPYEAAYINPRHTSMGVPVVAVNPRTDLDMLQSHRMSHVAETGQLTPRVRRPGNSGEWASVAENIRSPQEISSTANGVDYFVPQQKTPSPPPPPVRIPSYDAPLPSTSNPTQDSNAVNQARQAVPLLETYANRPFYLPETYQPRGPHNLHFERSYEEVPIEVNTTQNQRDSQVLRKVNSGFEILRPGTLQLPTPEEEEKAAMAEKRQSRRLQKKRRTSSGASRTPAFVEQV